MRSIFIALVIVTVFEVSPISSGAGVENGGETNTSDIQSEQILASYAPILVQAVTDLSSENVAKIRPHLEALTKAFANTPVERIFAYISTLCDHHDYLQRIRNAQRHIGQFFQQTIGQVPHTIRQTTRTTIVYESDDDDDDDDGQFAPPQARFQKKSNQNGSAKQTATADNRISQETIQNLQKLQNVARVAQAQIQNEIKQSNDLLRNKMQEAYVQTRQELRNTVNSIRGEAQRMYQDLKRVFAWLREEASKEIQGINEELEESKRAYKNNVEEFKTNIRNQLVTVNDAVQQQVTQVTDELKERLNSATGQLNSQLTEAHNQLNDETQRASDAVGTQVQQIRDKMRAAMEDIRAEMQNVDAELTQGIADASNGAKATGPMNARMRAEMEKAIAEMKNTTQEMREKMEKEIQTTVLALTKEIESILKEMRNAKNLEGVIPAVAETTITDTKADRQTGNDKADSKGNERTQTATENQKNAASERVEKNSGIQSSSQPLKDAVSDAGNKGDQQSSVNNVISGEGDEEDEEDDDYDDFDRK